MESPVVEENFDVTDVEVYEDSAAVDFYQPLTEDQARVLTDHIRTTTDVLWALIARAHAGKAWAALGYDTWADYVGEEFNMSRSRSYQLLDQARVVHEIEAAVPEGTTISISEAAARDLKGMLEEVVPEIRERTEGLDPAEAGDVLDEILNEKRERLKEEREAAYADADLDDEYLDAEYDGNYSGAAGEGGASYRDDLDDFGDDGDNKPDFSDINDVDVVAIRRAVNAAHDLYSSLSALAGLPANLEEVVDIIPRERYAQIDGNLDSAMANLQRFADLWNERREDDDTASDVDELDE